MNSEIWNKKNETYLDSRLQIKMSFLNNEEPKLTTLLNKIANTCSGKMDLIEFRKKTYDSSIRKIKLQFDNGLTISEENIDKEINCIKDFLRYTIVFTKKNFSKKVIEIVNNISDNGFKLLDFNNRFRDLFYKDVICHFTYHSGNEIVIFEIQFHTNDSLRAKKVTHYLYEFIRKNGKISIDEIEYLVRNAMYEEYKTIGVPTNMDEMDKFLNGIKGDDV